MTARNLPANDIRRRTLKALAAADAVIQALEGKSFDTIKGRILLRAYDHQAVQSYFIGKGAVTKNFPIPTYDAVKTYSADIVEKNFMPPPDPNVHPVRWRQPA